MVLPGLLDLAAMAVLVLSIWLLRRSVAQKKSQHRKTLVCLTAALVLVGASGMLNLSGLFQRATGINLRMPATPQTKARFWLDEHPNANPTRSEVGGNMRLIADGLVFYHEYGSHFPAEAHAKMEEYDKLPKKVDHVLSFAEEARYYYAAKEILAMIRTLAGEKPEDADMGKSQ